MPKAFDERVGWVKAPRGEKTALVDQAIARASGTFTLADLERTCPGVSRDMIRRVLRDRAKEGGSSAWAVGPARSGVGKRVIPPREGKREGNHLDSAFGRMYAETETPAAAA